MLYKRIIEGGTINEPEGKPDPQFALPSTVNWMRALSLLIADKSVNFASAKSFYATQGKRSMDALVENTVLEQLFLGLHHLSALEKMKDAETAADFARVGILAWYYGIANAASAMTAAQNGSFQEDHAGTANMWDRDIAARGLAMEPFSWRVSSLVEATYFPVPRALPAGWPDCPCGSVRPAFGLHLQVAVVAMRSKIISPMASADRCLHEKGVKLEEAVMAQTLSWLLPKLPLFIVIAIVTHLVMSFSQTLMHYKLGHHPMGGKFFRNHINFHHTYYSKDHLVSRTYLGDEGNNTPFFFIPVFLVGACTYLVLPVDLFVVQVVACAASFYAHVFFDKEYHSEGSWLQRFAWFRRNQELHFVHHRHANSNFAVIHFFWDRILGTYRRPDAG